jgi:hypothetical protein
MKNVEQTVISQYSSSETMMRLIQNMNEYIDPTADIDGFFDYVWNVETAQGFGLDIWGRIVGVSRSVQIPDVGTFFGFQNGTSPEEFAPFGQEPFYNGSATSFTYLLTDEIYRTVIMAKALSNISEVTAPAVNQLLHNVFPGIQCHVVDLGGEGFRNMAIRYIFYSPLSATQYAIIAQTGVILRPAGVSYDIYFPVADTTVPELHFSSATM